MSWTTPKTWAVGDPGTSPDLNTYIRDNSSFLYGDTAWTALSFVNSWVNAGSTNELAHFRKIGNLVIVEGIIESGTAIIVATLPAGYRPLATINGPATMTSGGVTVIGYWALSSAGVLTIQDLGGAVPSVAGFQFIYFAEQ